MTLLSERFAVLVVVSLLALDCVPQVATQTTPTSASGQMTARDYYKELYDAGGLDRMASEYVCFKDDTQHDTFFTFGQGKTIREYLTAEGTFNKLPKESQDALKDDVLIVRGYEKGILWTDDMLFFKDGDSWSSEKGQTIPLGSAHRSVIIRININWQTLRYHWGVEVVDKGQRHNAGGHFGRCDKVLTGVRQNGEFSYPTAPQ